MRLLIQRVNHASVKVDGEVIGNIGKGFLVLVGIGQNDTREVADKYMKKMLGLRIFEDENGKTNLSLADVNGELLMVSQFTLYANYGFMCFRIQTVNVGVFLLLIWNLLINQADMD